MQRDSQAGYTIVELLVSMVLAGIALGVIATDFSNTVHTRHDMSEVAETQQALKASMTFVTQELRQAGACLPEIGDFVALDGQNSGSRDSLTLRIGKTNPSTIVCIRSVTTADAVTNTTTLTLEDATGFDVDQYVYVTRTAGAGNTFRIVSVSADTITLDRPLDWDYLAGSGVYAIEERTYSIGELHGAPTLMVSIDGGPSEPMVKGVDVFDVRYRLDPCPPCVEVDIPADDTEWHTVRELVIRFVTESKNSLSGGNTYTLEETSTVRPRNLI